MADIADDADRHTAFFLQESLNKIKHKTQQFIGHCHYCNERVGASDLFCRGGECRDDWDKEQRIKRISGS